MKGKLRINSVTAFIMVHDDGSEGICGYFGRDGTMTPMIDADKDRIKNLRPIAADMAKKKGRTVKIVRFTHRENLDEILPS